jgi:tRNA (guanine-N7-)-methyltransferase
MKRKLERFRIIEERDNVVERSKPNYETIKGRWRSDFFTNNHPLTVELACGRGEYSVSLGARFKDQNFVGVDIKGERIWKGSTLAVEQGLTNVGFLRTPILLLDNFFEAGEVDDIWITFPDPRPRKRDIKRRLTSPRFLDMYKRLLRSQGYVRLKTDNTGLYDYTMDVLSERNDVRDLQYTNDVYASGLRDECFDIKTRYEEMFAATGESIKYLRFTFEQK